MVDGSQDKIFDNKVKEIFNPDLNNDGQIGVNIADEDGNRIVDGSEEYGYEIYNNGQAIVIQSRSGRT